MTDVIDAVVVGSGPNGLAAAVTIARAGLAVVVLEEQPTAGGGARTADLGLCSGVIHDLCSAVHPLAWASPFLREFGLTARGVDLIASDVSYAQPMPGRAGIAYRSIEQTAERLGRRDGAAWLGLLGPLVRSWREISEIALSDKRSVPSSVASGPGAAARFAADVVELGTGAWGRPFDGEEAKALLAGVATHAITPLPSLAGAGTALLLATLAHAEGGWPVPRGGSGVITKALIADLEAHGGRVETGRPVRTRADLPPARVYLFDTDPPVVADIFGSQLTPKVHRALRGFGHGPAAAKVDFVLSGPIPWSDPDVGRATAVHLGGDLREMTAAGAQVAQGQVPERPVVLLSDPTIADPGREHDGLRPVWSSVHVPAGCDRDMTESVTAQIERFAPGFRDLVVAAQCVTADRMATHTNHVHGDMASGPMNPWQMMTSPSPRWDPYGVGLEGVYLCSASAPPGPGVHGMSGWYAAKRALRHDFDVRAMPSLAS